MNVLVTGGAGYIGRPTCRQLVNRGHNVSVIDNGPERHLEFLPAAIKKFRGDILDPQKVREAAAAHPFLDAVIHLAATADIGKAEAHPAAAFLTNVSGTEIVAREAHRLGARVFILASTAMVYGKRTTEEPIAEDEELRPDTIYARSKVEAENRLAELSAELEFRGNVLRYFYVTGADRSALAPRTNIVTKAVDCILNERAVPVYRVDSGTRTPIRDYINVEDVACVNNLAVERLEKLPEKATTVFNIGRGSASSVHDVLDEIGRVTEREFAFQYEKAPAFMSPYVVGEVKKASQVLGFRAAVGLGSSVRTLVRWFGERR